MHLADTSDITEILANGRAFATYAYPSIPFDEESFFACVMQMMNDKLLYVIRDEDGGHKGGVGAIKTTTFLNNKILIATERFWWVKPAHRASGIGKELLAKIQEAAKEQGCAELWMIALEDKNLPYVDGFYQHDGFARCDHMYRKAL